MDTVAAVKSLNGFGFGVCEMKELSHLYVYYLSSKRKKGERDEKVVNATVCQTMPSPSL